MRHFFNQYNYILGITLLPITVVVVLGLFVWECGNYIKESKRKELSDVIEETVRKDLQNDLLLPKIIYIGVDTTVNRVLEEKLLQEISKTVVSKYMSKENNEYDDLEVKPFFVLPDKPDNYGNYTITEKQLNELRGHLIFLTNQVNKQLNERREEISADIDRLNLWVSIWIGIIGFFGIFIPIIINIDLRSSAEESKIKSEEALKNSSNALTKSDDALTKITNANLGRLDDFESRMVVANTTIGKISLQASSAISESIIAKNKSELAFHISELSKLVNNINRLSIIEYLLLHKSVGEVLTRLKNMLSDIHVSLSYFIDKPIDGFITDNVFYMSEKIFSISLALNRKNLTSMVEFTKFLKQINVTEFSKNDLEILLSKLQKLIEDV